MLPALQGSGGGESGRCWGGRALREAAFAFPVAWALVMRAGTGPSLA